MTQMYKIVRHLPISLIMDEDPAEHVFQFVVVNQKATPINQALLGTIVSTTLSNEELQRVGKRLEDADIPLEDSKSISFATRNPRSPFCGLIQTGISGEEKNKLQWSVMLHFIKIIKELKGGKLFHESIDYSNVWKKNILLGTDYSKIDDYNCETPFEYWSSDKGLWREFFIIFWTKIRDFFGNTEDKGASNYWGATTSNLFNKVISYFDI